MTWNTSSDMDERIRLDDKAIDPILVNEVCRHLDARPIASPTHIDRNLRYPQRRLLLTIQARCEANFASYLTLFVDRHRRCARRRRTRRELGQLDCLLLALIFCRSRTELRCQE